jgi:DNA-binding PadR family transcriptional regulator
MSVPHTLLGLLEPTPQHGYLLKQAYDRRFAHDRPLRFGQVYATLARLERDGLATVVGVEAGEGPDRKTYAITQRGVSEVESWLSTPEQPDQRGVGTLFAKVVLALQSGRSAADVLDAQRAAHLERMRAVLARGRAGDVLDRLAADYEIAHLEADLRWIETAGERLAQLRAEEARR